MNVRFLLMTATSLLLLAGCRTDPHLQIYIDNMNAEKRLLEDTLYDLQFDYETQLEEVTRLRRELRQLKSDSDGPATRSERSTPPAPAGRSLFPEIPELKPPTVDPGRRTDGDRPGPPPPSDFDDDLLQPPRLELGEETDDLSTAPLPDDRTVTQLYIHPSITGGGLASDSEAEDGLRVIFEPRNADQQFVPLPGRVTVALLDPIDRSRVARWEFDEAQTRLALQRARTGRGIELDLPWRGKPPATSRGQLVVRYRPPGGALVEQSREIVIPPPGRLARWTPRADQRPLRIMDAGSGSAAPNPNALGDDTSSATPAPRGPEPRQAGVPSWSPHR
jgi:hypothetical protein